MNELQKYEAQGGVTAPMTCQELTAQVHLIQEVMRAVMRDGEHYGIIPGCGTKPALLKAGAEKLGMTFHLAPEFNVKQTDHPNGHREYQVTCTLNGRHQGVGSCSTMEGKYRFRTGPKVSTGQPVPKEYWALRSSNPAKAQESIGGKGFSTMKGDSGIWEICVQGEKVEHDNPADYYNTVLKMAKKRAHVDAILTATAASDIFTQDIEEMAENASVANSTASPSAKAPTPTPPRQDTPQGNPGATAPRSGGKAKSADVLPPKEATEETKKWWLNQLSAASLVTEAAAWYRQENRLLPTEELTDLPLKFVPTSSPAGRVEIAAIQKFAFPEKAPDQDPLPKDAQKSSGKVEQIAKKDGHNSKGDYTKWGIKIAGTWYNTFSNSHGATAEQAKAAGETVWVYFTTDEYGKKIERLETEGAAQTPAPDPEEDDVPF